MKNLFGILAIAMVLSGCSSKYLTTDNVEKTWSIGKFLGGIFLPEDIKDKLKPTVDKVEEGYSIIKKDASSTEE
jgi:hypothetical protein